MQTTEEINGRYVTTMDRPDGSQLRITAQIVGLSNGKLTVDRYIHHKPHPDSKEWLLLGDQPAPNWRTMSIDEYTRVGRPPWMYHLSPAALMQCLQPLATRVAKYNKSLCRIPEPA